ncbi:hypothetical protein SAMN04488123_10229 [Natribacillus halophilus]|uniref:Uncharacterized protein n=1 Tax=Natribacillus halophilus TaxID=549003 RepID=A0A1G8KD14_9BACI|nr:hypothetical protein SAMN04488123_10229 [Natribacillus halophilus]
MEAKQTVYVNEFTDGILDPGREMAYTSGNDEPVEGRFLGDPFVAVKCPECGTMNPETVIHRATINGGIEIGRHPGVVTVTFLAPHSYLQEKGLLELVSEQYA